MSKLSKARMQANARYDAKTYEQIRANSRKDLRRIDMIRYAATRQGISYQSYIVAALDAALNRDGVTADALPPAPDAETTPADADGIQAPAPTQETDAQPDALS